MSDSTPKFTPQLSETLYAHLRAIAQNKLSDERVGHTLQATALVHEALMRMKPPPASRMWREAMNGSQRVVLL